MSGLLFEPDTWGVLNGKLGQLRSLSESLAQYVAELEARRGLSLTAVSQEFSEFAPAVLGGVDTTGSYKEASLAKVFNELFGFSVDTKAYCALKATSAADAEANTQLQFQRNLFSSFLGTVRRLSETALVAWEATHEVAARQSVNAKELFQNPMRAVEDARSLLRTLMEVSVGLDEGTTILWETRRITWRYLVATVPEARKPEVMEFFEKQLGISRLWSPESNPDGEYTIWGYPDYHWEIPVSFFEPRQKAYFLQNVRATSYGAAVLLLSRLAWLVFHGETGSAYSLRDFADCLFTSVPALQDIYWERAEGMLNRISKPMPFDRDTPSFERVEVKGPIVEVGGFSKKGNYSKYWEGQLLPFLDWLIPEISYGRYDVTLVNSREMRITKLQ